MYRFQGDFWPLLLSFFARGGEKPISSDEMQGIGRADSFNVCFNDGVAGLGRSESLKKHQKANI